MRKELLAKAEELGLDFPKNITDDALSKGIAKEETIANLRAEVLMLKNSMGNKTTDNSLDKFVEAMSRANNRRADAPTKGIAVEDLPNRQQLIDKAVTLIRCTIVPRDPSKVSYKSEVLTVTNDLLGEVQRYTIPFHIVTHIPYIIYKALVDKKVNIYDEDIVTGDKSTGQVTGGATTIDAYSIKVLPKLTSEEVKALAKRQQLRSTDDSTRETAILSTEDEEPLVIIDPLEEAGYII